MSQRLLVYSTDTLQCRCKGVVANLGSSKYVPQPDESLWSTSSVNFVRPEPVPLLLDQKTLDVRGGVEFLVHNEVGDTLSSVTPSASSLGGQTAEHKRIQKLHAQWTHLIVR